MLFVILAVIVCAISYRRIGGFYYGGKAAEKKWYNLRGFTVTVSILIYTLLFICRYEDMPIWIALGLSILWVITYRLIGYDSWMDFGMNEFYDDEKLAGLLQKIVKPKYWGSFLYDFSGLFFRWMLPSVLFFFILWALGWYDPLILILGISPAFIYLFCKAFDTKNPEIFDLIRTSTKAEEAKDPTVCRFLQKDKDLAEIMIGALNGLIFTI